MPESEVLEVEPEDIAETVEEDVPPTEEDMALPVPWYGILTVINTDSGDRRKFKAVTWRDLPVSLKIMLKDMPRHDESVISGNIQKVWLEGDQVWGSGLMDDSPYGYEATRLVATEMMRGVSMDADLAVLSDSDEVNENGDAMEVFESIRLSSATLCPIPAFQEAFIALGYREDHEADESVDDTEGQSDVGDELEANLVETYSGTAIDDATPATGTPGTDEVNEIQDEALVAAPVPRKTKDGPGWITHPKPTKRITDYWVDGVGAAKIGWGVPGDFNRCRANLGKYVQNPDWLAGLCANLHYRALRTWPGQQHSAEAIVAAAPNTEVEMSSSVNLVASAPPSDPPKMGWFSEAEADGPTPFTIGADGQVFGHVATWDVCHIGIGDSCVTAPTSASDYAYFHTGEVLTDEGPIAVGQISLGGGHASMEDGVRAAIAHYDQTSSVVCDVVATDGKHGIWVAGAVRPGATEDQIRDLRAAALSGDWRRVQGNLEMVAALAVNVPGFPIPRTALAASGTEQFALVAAGIPGGEVAEVHSGKAPVTAGGVLRAEIKAAMREITEEDGRRQRAGLVKTKFRALRISAAKQKIGL